MLNKLHNRWALSNQLCTLFISASPAAVWCVVKCIWHRVIKYLKAFFLLENVVFVSINSLWQTNSHTIFKQQKNTSGTVYLSKKKDRKSFSKKVLCSVTSSIKVIHKSKKEEYVCVTAEGDVFTDTQKTEVEEDILEWKGFQISK